jgi:hypothetical protein
MEMKKCHRCGRLLPATEDYFYRRSDYNRPLETSCRECRGTRFRHDLGKVRKYHKRDWIEDFLVLHKEMGNRWADIVDILHKRGYDVTIGRVKYFYENNYKYKKREVVFHRLNKHPLHRLLQEMKDRCYNKKNEHYKYYGGEGKGICDEWLNDFSAFYEWAISHGWRKGLTIDRIDNNKGYSPDNCRWVDMVIQANNKRDTVMIEYNGEVRPLQDWCRDLDLNAGTMYHRIVSRKWSVSKAFETPVRKMNRLYDYQGEKLTLTDIAKRNNMTYRILYNRLYNGHTLEEAIRMG